MNAGFLGDTLVSIVNVGGLMYQILSLDDSKVIRTMVKVSLKDALLAVDTVEKPMDALQMIEEKQYDLLIVDYRMPGMTGLDFMEQVRQNPSYAEIPFFMLTAEDGEDLKIRAQSLDAKAWIDKPFTPKQLKKLVFDILQ